MKLSEYKKIYNEDKIDVAPFQYFLTNNNNTIFSLPSIDESKRALVYYIETRFDESDSILEINFWHMPYQTKRNKYSGHYYGGDFELTNFNNAFLVFSAVTFFIKKSAIEFKPEYIAFNVSSEDKRRLNVYKKIIKKLSNYELFEEDEVIDPVIGKSTRIILSI